MTILKGTRIDYVGSLHGTIRDIQCHLKLGTESKNIMLDTVSFTDKTLGLEGTNSKKHCQMVKYSWIIRWP